MIIKTFKYTGLFLSVFIFFSVMSILGFFYSKAPHNYLRHMVTEQVKEAFVYPVEFGEVEGNFLNNIELKNVKIINSLTTSNSINVLSAEKINIEYNLFDFWLSRYGLKKRKITVRIDKPVLNVEHYRDDTFNFLKMFPDEKGSNNGFNLPLDIQIMLVGSTVSYYDERGFSAKPLDKPVFNVADLDIEINLTNKEIGCVAIGKVKDVVEYKPISIVANIIPSEGKFNIGIKSNSLSLYKWGNYFYELPGFKFRNGFADVEVGLKNHPEGTTLNAGDVPFLYDVDVKARKSVVSLPWLSMPLEDTSGRIIISNSEIDFKNIQGMVSSNNYRYSARLYNFSDLNADMKIYVPAFDVSTSPEFVDTLTGWGLKGHGPLKMTISSNGGNKWKLLGNTYVKNGEIYSHKIDDANVFFRLENQKVYVDVTKADFYGGNLVVRSAVDQQKKNFVKLKGKLVGADSRELLRNKKYFNGMLDFDFNASGLPENLNFNIKATSDDFIAAGQRIPSVSIKLKRTPEYLDFNSIKAETLYGNIINSKGYLYSDKSFEFMVSSNGLLVNNLNSDFSDIYIATELDSVIRLNGIWDRPLFENPLDNLDMTSFFKLREIIMDDQVIDEAAFSALVSGGRVHLDNIFIKEPSASISAEAVFDKAGLMWSHINSKSFPLSKMKIVKEHLPEVFNPVTGLLDADIEYSSVGKNKVKAVLNVSGMEGVSFQRFDSVSLNVDWDGNSVDIKSGTLVNKSSVVNFKGNYSKQSGIMLNFSSRYFDLNDFSGLTSDYGSFSGFGSGRADVSLKDSVEVSLNARLNDARYGDIFLDEINGGFKKHRNSVEFSDLKIKYGADKYSVDGFLGIDSNSDYNLTFDVEEVSLKNLISLVEKGYSQYNLLKDNSFVYKTLMPDEKILKNYLTLGKGYGALSSSILYSSRSSVFSGLKDYLNRVEGFKKGVVDKESSWADRFGGLLSGNVKLSKFMGKRSLVGDINVKKGYFSFITFDNLSAKVTQQEDNYRIISKVIKGKLGEAEYDSLSLDMLYDSDKKLRINKFDFAALGQTPHNILKGVIPLGYIWDKTKNEKLDVVLDLSRNNINLVSVFNSSISSIKNEGEVVVHIGGTLVDPIFNSRRILLKNAAIQLSDELHFKSPFMVKNSNIKLDNNLFSIPLSEISWKGKDTSYDSNKLVVSGNIALQKLSFYPFEKVVLDFDLGVKETSVRIVMPKLFSGYIKAKDLSFKGPLTIPISASAKKEEYERYLAAAEVGPVLSGNLSIYDAEIPLQPKKTFILKPSILFDLKANILTGVYVSGGSLVRSGFTGLVNGIDVELQETKLPLFIHGSLNSILVDGEVSLANGEISIFDRIFRVLPYDYQQEYFSYDNSLKKNNKISFVSDLYDKSKRRKTIPYFSLATISEIDAATSNITGDESESSRYTGIMHYIVLIEGKLDDPNSMSIFRFNQLKNYNYELMAGYPIIPGALKDEEVTELARYLLPDLLRPELYEELFEKGLSSDKARQAIGNLSETQINSLFSRQLRPIERDVAHTIGAHDIRIDYNLGKAVNKAVTSAQKNSIYDEVDQEKETIVGLDVAYKLFFDRLYVRFRTQLDQDKTSRDVYLNLAEYKLSYSIYEWLSLNYLNRTTLNDDQLPEVYSLEALYRF